MSTKDLVMQPGSWVADVLGEGFEAIGQATFLQVELGARDLGSLAVRLQLIGSYLAVGESLLSASPSRVAIAAPRHGQRVAITSVEFGPSASGLLTLVENDGPTELRQLVLLGTRGAVESEHFERVPWSVERSVVPKGLEQAVAGAMHEKWGVWAREEST
ncbi:hypothetical protein ACQP1W_44745 [Spirillospora sp. CA-255316]